MKQMYSSNLSAKDNIVIPNYVAGFQNGIDVPEEFMNKEVYAGHPVYKQEGKFSLVPVTEDEYQAVEGAEYVGVLKSSLKTDEHFNRTLAVMDLGVVETEAMDIKYSDALLKELKSNLKSYSDNGITRRKSKDIVKEVNAQLLAQIRISEERMLFPKISYDEVIPSGFWSSVKSVYVNPAADYKDADGEAALKSNPTESAAIGRLPIIAIKRELNSRLMEDIEELINGGYSDDAVVKKVTEIQRLNIDSVFLRLELDSNRALSNGVIVTNDGTNTNIDNIRVDYLIPKANKYETKVEGGITLEDVKNVIKDAKNRAIYFELALADSDTLDKLGQAEDMRKAYATKKGISGVLDGQLDLEQINEYFKPKYGFEFVETTPNVRVEIKGTATPKEAWKPGVVTFVPTAKPIKIGHKGVIEKRMNFNDGDVYTDLGKYSMMSVLSQKKDPYTIVSRLETRAVPILDAADAVCILSTKKVEIDPISITPKSPLDGTIPQVKENLEDLSEEELQSLLEEEIAGANRKGVTDFITNKLSE